MANRVTTRTAPTSDFTAGKILLAPNCFVKRPTLPLIVGRRKTARPAGLRLQPLCFDVGRLVLHKSAAITAASRTASGATKRTKK
jgi:hypothetical protein